MKGVENNNKFYNSRLTNPPCVSPIYSPIYILQSLKTKKSRLTTRMAGSTPAGSRGQRPGQTRRPSAGLVSYLARAPLADWRSLARRPRGGASSLGLEAGWGLGRQLLLCVRREAARGDTFVHHNYLASV